jgi:hypothetical protein
VVSASKSRIVRVLILTVAVASTLAGCDSGGPLDGGLDPSTGDVLGRVTVDGSPRSGVTVSLRRSGTVIDTAVTDGNGEYEFLELDPGPYSVSISQISGVQCPGSQQASVVANQGAEVNFACTTTGTVTGQVTVNGTPVSGIVVTLREGSMEIAQTTTEAAGTYLFPSATPGGKIVEITSPTGATCDNQVNITVLAGGIATANFPCTGQVVTGQLTVNGVGEPGVVVFVCEDFGGGEVGCLFPRSRTDSEGRYRYNQLNPGNYIVFIETLPAGATCPVSQEPVNVPAGATVTVDIFCTRP